ncbi:MAG TPA: prephenate dehydrogenase/arogenate dehydrogenase family protein [Clostridiales bacterium]|jgi:prephenate dehydrogenase|nr:prephenate dehydrogenase/arogenate dehydrogenase family protein [Clostridiales bacterium]
MIFVPKTPKYIAPKTSIGVVGLGCIGGSVASAFSKTQQYNIIGVDKDNDTLRYAFEKDIIQLGHSELEILKGCEVVFVCTPIDTVSPIINQLFRILGTSAIITDVASIKGAILDNLPEGVRFVGGHPMAGSEQGGIKAAKDHMFENAYYVITPCPNTSKEDLDYIIELVKQMQALPVIVDKKTHDITVAKISHLPHMVAYAMVNTCIDNDISKTLAAGGFRDITRIASSPSKMWLDIVALNKDNILAQLDNMIKSLSQLSHNLKNDQYDKLKEMFESARQKRDSIEKDKGGFFSLRIDVKDVPGIIAKITLLLYKKKINIKNINIENSREGEGGALVVSFENSRALETAKEIFKKKKFDIKTE